MTDKEQAMQELAEKLRELFIQVQAMAEAQGQGQECKALLTATKSEN